MIVFGTLLAISISTADLRREFAVASSDAGIVRDAGSRWIRKNAGQKKAMDNRVPIVAHFPKYRCVILQLRSASVGGSPIYCYNTKNVRLISKYDDVE